MKKFLLLGAAVLIAVSASAQAKRVSAVEPKTSPKLQLEKLNPSSYSKEVKATDANFGAYSSKLNKGPQKANIIDLWYTRPAGVFPVGPVCVDGEYMGKYGITFYLFKPWKDYTFRGYIEGLDEGANPLYAWRYTIYDEEYDDYSNQKDLLINYPMYTQDVMPVFFACFGNDYEDENAEWFEYQSMYYTFNYNDNPPSLTEYEPNLAVALPSFNSFSDIEGYELYCYQHEFTPGGRFGEQPYTAIRYTGLKAFDPEEEAAEEGSGYWFGKNAGSIDGHTHVDGIAQAFEKPEHPYLLKRIGVELGYVNLVGPVEFTCKVYKLDALPEYDPEYPVALPAEPGELIATGKFTATPDMVDPNYNDLFLDFALMGHDEFDPTLEYEITPTVDYPILVVLDNYNDEGMENLKQFTTFCAYDWGRMSSQDFGETAYLKVDRADEDGVFHNDYMWYGMHNFLGDYYTAFQISINIEQPFIDTYVTGDDEYTFPDEGGEMVRDFIFETEEGEEEMTMYGVYFVSNVITSEGDWYVTWNDEEELPDWLHLELADLQVGDAYSYVAATPITADPLPEGVTYREAKIRFEIPGDYIYYTFKQGTAPEPNRYDVNHDGEVNVADINCLIDYILTGSGQHDVNGDGEMTVADINALIDYILNH